MKARGEFFVLGGLLVGMVGVVHCAVGHVNEDAWARGGHQKDWGEVGLYLKTSGARGEVRGVGQALDVR